MKSDTVESIARESNNGCLGASVFLVVVCLFFFGISWKHFFLTGPVPLTEALAVNPGIRDYFTFDGPLVASGVVEKSSLTIKGIPLPSSVSADYRLTGLGRRLLVVKVSPDFKSGKVEGHLDTVPKELNDTLKGFAEPYPHMLVADTGYFFDVNLFTLISIFVFPVALVGLAISWWRSLHVLRLGLIRGLKRFGPPLEVARKIDAEMAEVPEENRVGPIYFCKSWMVVSGTDALIVAIEEVVAFSVTLVEKKSGNQITAHPVLRYWTTQSLLEADIKLKQPQVEAVASSIAKLYPWLAMVNAKEFADKWTKDRAACRKEAEERRAKRFV